MSDAFKEYLIEKNTEIIVYCRELIGEMYREDNSKTLSLDGNFTIEQLEAIIFIWHKIKKNKLTDFRYDKEFVPA